MQKAKVMISYRNVPKQKAFALELNSAFLELNKREELEIETWIDVKDIPRLGRWLYAIADGIESSNFVVICLSKDYFESKYCLIECDLARSFNKRILPINVSEDPDFDVQSVLASHTETKGFEDLMIASMYGKTFSGLHLSTAERIQRIVQSILPSYRDAHYHVFISYVDSQATLATQLANEINNYGIHCFNYSHQINVGDGLRNKLLRPLLQANTHIVILTPDIVNDPKIKVELDLSNVTGTKLIPYLPAYLVNNQTEIEDMRRSFDKTRKFKRLNDIPWFMDNLGNKDDFDSLYQRLT